MITSALCTEEFINLNYFQYLHTNSVTDNLVNGVQIATHFDHNLQTLRA